MKHWTVKRRLIAGFSAVMVIMVVLSLFAYERLAAIETLTAGLRGDYVPSLYLAGRLEALSIQGQASVRQHVAAPDPEKVQQLLTDIQQKSLERTDLLTQHDVLLSTPDEHAAAQATRAALAPFVATTGVFA